MSDFAPGEWWELLPAGIRAQVDGHVLQDDPFRAIRVLWEAGRAQGMVSATRKSSSTSASSTTATWCPDPRRPTGPGLTGRSRRPCTGSHRQAAVRHLGGEDTGPLHPSAAVAERVGRALADRLSVPFHCVSPHTPDDEAPGRRP